jgi:hypothetical protein
MGILCGRNSRMRASYHRTSIYDLIERGGVNTSFHELEKVLYLDKIDMPLVFSWECVGHRMAR